MSGQNSARVWAGNGAARGRHEAMREEGVRAATPASKETLHKQLQLSFSQPAKSSILGHISLSEKAHAFLGAGTTQDFPILTLLPKRQAPNGQSVPQASSAPPSPSATRPACNGLVVPPPPTASLGRGKLGRRAALGTPGLSGCTPGP